MCTSQVISAARPYWAQGKLKDKYRVSAPLDRAPVLYERAELIRVTTGCLAEARYWLLEQPEVEDLFLVGKWW